MKNSSIKGIKLIGVLCIGFVLFGACSPQASEKRFVSVTGRSSISKSPDQVSISFSVFSKDRDLSAAKKKNDAAIKRFGMQVADRIRNMQALQEELRRY